MDKFRDKLKLQIWINAACIAVLVIVQVIGFSRQIRPTAADGHWSDMWNGFLVGAAFGIMALFVVGLVKDIMALRDEKKMKKLYIAANDERQQSIYTAARSAGAQVFLMGGLVAGIAAGYFSVPVSITIIACVFIHSLICAGFNLYFGRKY